MEIAPIQKLLAELELDGWLLFDNHGSNRFVRQLLLIPLHFVMTRRFFFFIPQKGEPVLITHRIEADNLDFLPGKKEVYLSKEELELALQRVLKNVKKVGIF